MASYEGQEYKWRQVVQLLVLMLLVTCHLDDGVPILELTKRAYELYKKQNPAENRKLLLSNCTLEKGKLTAE